MDLFDPSDERLVLVLSPGGRLRLETAGSDEAELEPSLARRIRSAFEKGEGSGLFHLGAAEVSTPLPPSFGFWRDFARHFVAALCSRTDLEDAREAVEVPAAPEDLDRFRDRAPPMTGGEYFNLGTLASLWNEMLNAFQAELGEFRGTVQEFLTKKNPTWNIVGRVHFHLAENKGNPDHPFAFLASYTTGLSAQGKPQHRALGDAVRESSSAKDKNRLLSLLLPVQKAAGKSALVKELVDSEQLFTPQAWTPAEAYRLLKDIPALEDCGVVVRVPDFWKARTLSRPQVTVAVGTKQPAAIGLQAMLDFSVKLTLDGESISEADLEAFRSNSNGLVLLKGKWVEMDSQKLDEVLARWRAVEREAKDGISFIEGMRLLAGIPSANDLMPVADRQWVGFEQGAWLSDALGNFRSNAGNVDLGAGLRATLRPYQKEGLQWLWFLSQLKLGACLADDMGLGKTLQILALLLLLKERRTLSGPHLLVVPASLIANWKAEADRFVPSLRIFVAHASAGNAQELAAVTAEQLSDFDVVIASYGTAQRLDWVARQKWGLVVLDEAQAIKNSGTKQARAMKLLNSEGRIALTGTPVENRLGDLWSIFDFLNPGLLGSAKEFGAFVKNSKAYGPLRQLVRPYVLRRLKTDRSVISDLPEKTELNAFCALTKRQAALYRESVESLAEKLKQVEGMERRGLVLSYLMRFKQICNHPSQWLGDGEYAPGHSGKFERLREICETVASRQEKVLVFTQFREMTTPLANWLSNLFGKQGLVLSGETPVKQRQEGVKRFQEDERVPFFVLSLKAGGTGLNLTAASHVVHFDRWWNPAVENQATDRAFRIGQKKNVLVHKFVCRGTIEERIDALIEAKQGVTRELFEGDGDFKITELGDDALMKLVALDIHAAQGES